MEEEKNEQVENEELDIDDLTDDDLDTEENLDESESKKQTREENKRFAELRRQHEAEQKKVKELEEKNRELNDQIRYSTEQNLSDEDLEELGIEKVETEDELFLAQEYVKAKSKGENNAAVIAYRKLRNRDIESKNKAIEEKQKAEEESLIKKDVQDCMEKFKKTPTEIIKDKGFMDLYGEAIHNGNVGYLYEKYLKIVAAEKKASESEKQKNIPPLPNGSNGKPTKTYSEMSKQEKINYLREQHLIN